MLFGRRITRLGQHATRGGVSRDRRVHSDAGQTDEAEATLPRSTGNMSCGSGRCV